MPVITAVDAPRFIQQMEIIDCANCGIQFGMPQEYVNRRRKDGQGFQCPNGHGNYYGDTEEKRLRRELERAKESNALWRKDYAETREQLKREERSHAATKGVLTKTRKRIAAGVCPYCHRNFVALGKHIRGQHPGECGEEA